MGGKKKTTADKKFTKSTPRADGKTDGRKIMMETPRKARKLLVKTPRDARKLLVKTPLDTRKLLVEAPRNNRKLLVETPRDARKLLETPLTDTRTPGKRCIPVPVEIVKNAEHNKGNNILKSPVAALTAAKAEGVPFDRTKGIIPREDIVQRTANSRVDVRSQAIAAPDPNNQVDPCFLHKCATLPSIGKEHEPSKLTNPHSGPMGDNNACKIAKTASLVEMQNREGNERFHTHLIAAAKMQLNEQYKPIPTYRAPTPTYIAPIPTYAAAMSNNVHAAGTYATVLKMPPKKVESTPVLPCQPNTPPSARFVPRKWELEELKEFMPRELELEYATHSKPWSRDRTFARRPEAAPGPVSCGQEVVSWRSKPAINLNWAHEEEKLLREARSRTKIVLTSQQRAYIDAQLMYDLTNEEYFLNAPPPENGIDYIHDKARTPEGVEYLISFENATGSYWLDEGFLQEQCPNMLRLFEGFEQRREGLLRKLEEHRLKVHKVKDE